MIAATSLLAYERELRGAADRSVLERHIADLTPALLGADRVLVFRSRGGRQRLVAASYVSSLEPDAPAVRELEKGLAERGAIVVRDRKGSVLAHVVAEGTDDDAANRALRDHLAEVWAEAYLARGHKVPRKRRTSALACAGLAGLAALAFVPFPLVALAQFEIVPRDPVPIVAPMDGVVAELRVDADASVAAGTVIAALDVRDLKANLDAARERLRLAGARYAAAGKDAFRFEGNGADVTLAKAENRIARAERDTHAERLARAELRAPEGGVVLHDGRERWIGRPVRTGELIARLADPQRVSARIELAVSDALVIAEGAAVRLFPDGSLAEHAARIDRASFLPEATPDGRLVYPLRAATERPLRIGTRGTARIKGARAPLWYHVLRRPLTTLRQRLGL